MADGVYVFDMFSAEFCSMLLGELEHYEASGLPVVRPNSMNNYGVVLNSIGLEGTMDAIQMAIVSKLGKALFPREGGSNLDHHHSFMVQYKAGEDLGLDMHTDACDVTLNVCLGKQFEGAGLTLCGLRGSEARDERTFRYNHAHKVGVAIMHLGHQRHGADDLISGERYNLIMWNKSSTHRLTRDFVQKYRLAAETGGRTPDKVCLSYTHDDDYLEASLLPTLDHICQLPNSLSPPPPPPILSYISIRLVDFDEQVLGLDEYPPGKKPRRNATCDCPLCRAERAERGGRGGE